MRLVGYLAGYDLAGQQKGLTTWAEVTGDVLVTWARDEGDVGLERRLGFADAVAVVAAGDAEGVLVRDLARFSSDVVTQEVMLAELWSVGARVVSIAGEPAADAGHVEMSATRALIGDVREALESLGKLRAAHARETRRKAGRVVGGRAPFGYRSVEGVLQPDPAEQVTVARIRELRGGKLTDPAGEGMSLRQVAATLNSEGRKRRGGGAWSAEAVRLVCGRLSS